MKVEKAADVEEGCRDGCEGSGDKWGSKGKWDGRGRSSNSGEDDPDGGGGRNHELGGELRLDKYGCERRNAPGSVKGITEFKFPSVDPLYLPSLVVGEGTTGAVRVVQNFKDVNIYGISKAKIQNLKTTVTDSTFLMDVDALIDTLNLKGDYSLNGQVLVLPIVGNGKCDIKLRNLKIKATFSCKIIEKEGQTYAKVEDVKANLKPEKVEFQFDNLFNGDKQLADQILKLLNDNWSEVYEDIRPGYEEAIALIAKNITNLIFMNVPYDSLFAV
ncbi:hypothetical protein ILUMI_05359 [Ignelater luminosus]|uniref:Uncharacterized protein n=1 Tax=Ignelater luminosus TaxID=2038154 RepID=A0A8K0DHU0_IGNLU|nr:hypothetical protein ILUMI_05359 [Ignelater luminosus]